MTLYLSREMARAVDQRAIAEYGMASLVLMENAGRGCADVLSGSGVAGPILICCGKGNNGGDGLVLARHLDLRGWDVLVLLCCDPEELRGDARANYAIAEHAGLRLRRHRDLTRSQLSDEIRRAACCVDALLGTGARGEPRPPIADVIEAVNACSRRTLAIDLPSGLDCDSGQPAGHTIRADDTCTFVAPKLGFRAAAAKSFLGTVHVLDIGAPRRLVQEILAAACDDSQTI